MRKNICGIYCIKNVYNNKRYIGQSINICKRWQDHQSDLRNNQHVNIHLQAAYNKYGEDCFRYFIIEECTKEELDDREIFWINYYDTYYNGYNRNLGGKSWRKNIKLSKEQRKAISIALTGRPCKENTRKLMSKHMKDQYKDPKFLKAFQKNIDSQKTAIICYNINGFVKKYSSIHDAARDLKLEATNICKVLKGKHKTCGGYTFSYQETPLSIDEIQKRYQIDISDDFHYTAARIIELNQDGEVVEVFQHIQDAADKYNLDASSISKVCRGKLKQTKGHYFQYAA